MKLQFKHPQDRPYLVWEKSIETHPFFQKLEENLSELSSAKFATIFFLPGLGPAWGYKLYLPFFLSVLCCLYCTPNLLPDWCNKQRLSLLVYLTITRRHLTRDTQELL